MRISFAVIVSTLCVACGPSRGAPATPTAPTTTAAPTPAPAPPVTTLPGGLHFTAAPMDISAIQSITALGNMAPWGHTLPTDHIYIEHHPNGPSNYTPVPVYAPGSGTIEFISNGRVDVVVDSVFRYWIGPLAC